MKNNKIKLIESHNTNANIEIYNVKHFYTDPKDGKIKVKEFGSGNFNEIQSQIEAFMKSLGDNLENNE